MPDPETMNIDPPAPTFVRYMEKSRAYYLAEGHPVPYRWAHFDDAPFAPLTKPLSESRIGLVTTAMLHGAPPTASGGNRKQAAPGGNWKQAASGGNWKQAYAAPWDPSLPSLFTDDLSWDKDATHTDDRESYLPLQVLQDLAAAGRIASVAPRFYGVPTEYSQRRTKDGDAPLVAEWCREDHVDAVVLVPL